MSGGVVQYIERTAPDVISGLAVSGIATVHEAQGTIKETLGSINVRVACTGELVNPGAVIATDDGVCIVRRRATADALEKVRARKANEAEKRARFLAGGLDLDIYGMCRRSAVKGLKNV